jgi:hypothetical protein
MLCRKIITVYIKDHTKRKILYGEHSDYLMARVYGTHSNHCGLNGHYGYNMNVMNLIHFTVT